MPFHSEKCHARAFGWEMNWCRVLCPTCRQNWDGTSRDRSSGHASGASAGDYYTKFKKKSQPESNGSHHLSSWLIRAKIPFDMSLFLLSLWSTQIWSAFKLHTWPRLWKFTWSLQVQGRIIIHTSESYSLAYSAPFKSCFHLRTVASDSKEKLRNPGRCLSMMNNEGLRRV